MIVSLKMGCGADLQFEVGGILDELKGEAIDRVLPGLQHNGYSFPPRLAHHPRVWSTGRTALFRVFFSQFHPHTMHYVNIPVHVVRNGKLYAFAATNGQDVQAVPLGEDREWEYGRVYGVANIPRDMPPGSTLYTFAEKYCILVQ